MDKIEPSADRIMRQWRGLNVGKRTLLPNVRSARSVHYRGTEMVEMAIVGPLLVVLTLGAIEYGWIFTNMQRVANATRQGARVQAALAAKDATSSTQCDGEKVIRSLIPSSWIKNLSVTTSGGVVTAAVTVYVRPGGAANDGIAVINAPTLIPIRADWTIVIKMAKESLV